MKIAIIALLVLLGGAFAQDDFEVEAAVSPPDDASVVATVEWPANDDENAGALISMAFSEIGDGSCTVEIPGAVRLFHVLNGHIVPGEDTKAIEGTYKVAAPADWEAINGTLEALIMFNDQEVYNISDISFTCDPADVEDLSVYSFPQNDLQKEASSNVFYRPGFHQNDVLTITLPQPVKRFNITGADSELNIDIQGETITVSGFKNEEGIDDHKEVHFSLDYLEPEEGDDAVDTWFSAADVSVAVTREEEDEEAP